MHIVLISEDFYPTLSGGAIAQWRFAQLAVEEGHDVTIFTKRLDGTPARELKDGIDIHRPQKAQPASFQPNHPIAFICRITFSIYLAILLVFWLRKTEADVIISVSHLTHWIGKLQSMVFGQSHLNFIGYSPSLKSEFQWSLDFIMERINFIFFMGDRVFCRAPHIQSIISRYTNDVQLIHGILNSERIIEAHEEIQIENKCSNQTKKELVFVGRMTPLKQPDKALCVVKELPSNYRLVMIGDGPLRKRVEDEIQDSVLNEQVDILGKRSHTETLKRIATADGLLMTSKAEAYPTVVFEALVTQTPVFAPPVGILPQIDQERLHVSSIDDFPGLIQKHIQQSQYSVDKDILKTYSMETYSRTMLNGIGDVLYE